MSSYKLVTYQSSTGPRAGIVFGDAIYDAAESTGHAEYTTVMAILDDWARAETILRALKPRGRVAFVEYRGEDPRVPIKPLHKMTERQVRREAELHGLKWERTSERLPWQHLVIFRKR